MQNQYIPTLQHKRDFIALEAMTSTDVQSLLKNVFPSILAGFTGFANHFMPEAPGIKLNSKQANWIKQLDKHQYSDLATLGVVIPEGLNVSYLEYVDVLKPAVDHAVTNVFQGLNEFTLYLAQIINTEEAKFSSRSFKQTYSKLQGGREELNTDLGKCFKKGSTASESTYKQVIKRNSDWTKVMHFSDSLADELNKVDRTALNKKVQEVKDLLNIIQNKIEREEFKGSYPALADNIAEGTYQIASELEFYSITYYKVLVLQESIQQTVQRLTDVFKN